MILSPPYLKDIFDINSREKILNNAVEIFKTLEIETPTGVVGCGLSGTLFATLFAQKINSSPVIVRKKEEKRHSSNSVEGLHVRKHNVLLLVDDLICSGNTMNFIMNEIKDFTSKNEISFHFLKHGILYFGTAHRDFNGVNFLSCAL